jgi:hypothetical protein
LPSGLPEPDYRRRLHCLTETLRRFGIADPGRLPDLIAALTIPSEERLRGAVRALQPAVPRGTAEAVAAAIAVELNRLPSPTAGSAADPGPARAEYSPWDIDQLRPFRRFERFPEALPLLVREQTIKSCFARIFQAPSVPNDWGGELHDLLVDCSVNGEPQTAAFMLKGRSVARRLEIKNCGSKGDQLLRLSDAPAELLVVQHIDEISDSVRRAMHQVVELRRSRGLQCHCCFLDGTYTAAILRGSGIGLEREAKPARP